MPVITVKSNDSAGKLELHKFAEEISVKTGIVVSRLQIIAEYYPPEDFTDNVTPLFTLPYPKRTIKIQFRN